MLPRGELAKGRERSEELFSRQACKWELWRFPQHGNSGFPSAGSLAWIASGLSAWDCVELSQATLCTDLSRPHCSITVLQSMKLGIDVNRHKEIIVKSISALLLLLLKHFKLNHIYQVSSWECFSTGLRCSPGPVSQRRDTRALVAQLSLFCVSLRESKHLLHKLGVGVGSGMWGTVLQRCRRLCPLSFI